MFHRYQNSKILTGTKLFKIFNTFTGESDKLVDASNGTQSTFLQSGKTSSNEATSHTLFTIFTPKVVDQTFIIGKLNESDMKQEYGSSTSANYKPFIQDPEMTRHRTSRLLLNRIMNAVDSGFYISSLNRSKDIDGSINITISENALKRQNDTFLIYWDTNDEIWRSIQESCGAQASHLSSPTFQFCGQTPNPSKKPFSLQPTYFVLCKLTEYYNSPPKIVNTYFKITKGKDFSSKLYYTDEEKDTALFYLLIPPQKGKVILDSNGHFTYKPEDNNIGRVSFVVTLKENKLFSKAKVDETILFDISFETPAPELFVSDNTYGIIKKSVQKNNHQEIIVRVLKKTKVTLVYLMACDLDSKSKFKWHLHSTNKDSTFEVVKMDNSFEKEVFDGCTGFSTEYMRLEANLPQGFTGEIKVEVIVSNDQAYSSHPVTVNIRLYQHECDRMQWNQGKTHLISYSDCSHYIECVDRGANVYESFERLCPPGTFWHDKASICDRGEPDRCKGEYESSPDDGNKVETGN